MTSDSFFSTFAAIPPEQREQITRALERLAFRSQIPLLEALEGGPKAIGSTTRIKDTLERMKSAGLVDCSTHIPYRPHLWWMTPKGRDALAQYRNDSADAEMRATTSAMESMIENVLRG